VTIQVIVNELARINLPQLCILNDLIEEQTQGVAGVKGDALAGRVGVAAVIHATLQCRTGLLMCGFVVKAGHDSVTRNRTQRVSSGVCY